MSKIFVFVLVVFCIYQVLGIHHQDEVLEWVKYDPDDISEDAIPYGHTLNHTIIYIARAYMKDGKKEGYIPTRVVNGDKCVYIPINTTSVKVCDNIEILVGKNDYLNTLYWDEARPTNVMQYFDSDIVHPVRAGWEIVEYQGVSYNLTLYFGGISYGGEAWIGKIFIAHPDRSLNNVPSFAYIGFSDPVVYDAYQYEVLLYQY